MATVVSDPSGSRRLASTLVLAAALVLGCGSTQPSPGASPTIFVDTASGINCQLDSTSACIYAVQVAQQLIGIDSNSMVTVVPPPPGPVRTASDIALLVMTDTSGRRHLILLGRVGTDPDPDPRAWVPDRETYAEWYQAFGAE